LKSMSPNAVLGTKDVGQRRVLALGEDEPMAMPATGALIGTPASHERERDPQTDASELDPFDESNDRGRDGAHRGIRSRRITGSMRRSASRPVPDLAALGPAHESRSLPWKNGGKLVVVHVPLRLVDADGVQHLVHSGACRRVQDIEHLGCRRARQAPSRRQSGGRADLGESGPDVGRAAPVDAEAFLDYPLSGRPSWCRRAQLSGFPLAFGELRGKARATIASVASPSAALRSVLVVIAFAVCSDRLRRRQHARRRRRRSRRNRTKSMVSFDPALRTSSRWSSIDSRIQVFATSRTVAITSSVDPGRPPVRSTRMTSRVPPASTMDDGYVGSRLLAERTARPRRARTSRSRPPGRWHAEATIRRSSTRRGRHRSAPRRECLRS